MYEIYNNSIDYKCVICGQGIANMPVLDESRSVIDGFNDQHLQILISGRVEHKCNLDNQIQSKPATGQLSGEPTEYTPPTE